MKYPSWKNRFIPISLAVAAASAGCDVAPDESGELDPPVTAPLVAADLEKLQAGKVSRYGEAADLQQAVAEKWAAFKEQPELRRQLAARYPNAADQVDRFNMYLLQELGRVEVGGSEVLSAGRLAARVKVAGGPIQQAQSTGHPPAEVQQNQDSYKCQGESFRQDFVAYNDIGGLTQFKKKRRNWTGFTRWWDTDALNISVRVVYFINPPYHPYSSFAVATGRDHNTNDDYVSDRSFSAGAKLRFSFNGEGITGVKTPQTYVADNYDAVVSYHAVDHGGFSWRLVSSRGLRPEVRWESYGHVGHHVPWL